jgi:hypothetical protein
MRMEDICQVTLLLQPEEEMQKSVGSCFCSFLGFPMIPGLPVLEVAGGPCAVGQVFSSNRLVRFPMNFTGFPKRPRVQVILVRFFPVLTWPLVSTRLMKVKLHAHCAGLGYQLSLALHSSNHPHSRLRQCPSSDSMGILFPKGVVGCTNDMRVVLIKGKVSPSRMR